MGSADGADFPVLSRVVVAMSAAQNVDAQFEFNLSVVFAGLTAKLQSVTLGRNVIRAGSSTSANRAAGESGCRRGPCAGANCLFVDCAVTGQVGREIM